MAQLTLDAGSELVAVPVDLAVAEADEAAAARAVEAAIADIRSRVGDNKRSVSRPIVGDAAEFPDYDEYRG